MNSFKFHKWQGVDLELSKKNDLQQTHRVMRGVVGDFLI
jgi:hypothetical protein